MPMIDEKKIEETAQRAADLYEQDLPIMSYYEDTEVDGQHHFCKEFGAELFKDGAKWAINEFLKDLWHPISEEPREKTTLLIEISITKLTSRKLYYADTFIGQDWKIKCSVMSISRWLYIDDLIKTVQMAKI